MHRRNIIYEEDQRKAEQGKNRKIFCGEYMENQFRIHLDIVYSVDSKYGVSVCKYHFPNAYH
jgi:hypothetical protein